MGIDLGLTLGNNQFTNEPTPGTYALILSGSSADFLLLAASTSFLLLAS